MISKGDFIELVIEAISGGPNVDNRKFHPNVVAKYVELAINSFISSTIDAQLMYGDYSVNNGWIKPYDNVRIRYDQIRGQCYIKLPAKPILMKNNRGIREITWGKTDGTPAFIINDASAWNVISRLESSELLPGQFNALVESDKIFFPDMDASYKGKKVQVKIVTGVQSYDDDDILPMEESKSIEIATATLNLMNVQKVNYIKVANNSNPNTP